MSTNATIDTDTGLQLRRVLLDTPHEYLLAIITILMSFLATTGSGALLMKLHRVRARLGVQMSIYVSILQSNLLMSVFTMPFTVYKIIVYRIPGSKGIEVDWENQGSLELLFCNVSGFVYNVTRSTTIWSLFIFTLDRYLFLCHPFRAQRIRHIHYQLGLGAVWTFFILLSASVFFFGKTYRILDGDDLVCSWRIFDIIPKSLEKWDEEEQSFIVSYEIAFAYYLVVVYCPILSPIILLILMSIKVVVELVRLHVRTRKLQPAVTIANPNGPTIGCTVPAMSPTSSPRLDLQSATDYLAENRELRIGFVMTLSTICFFLCYSVWILYMILVLLILLQWIPLETLYGTKSTTLAQLTKISEFVGFCHAAFTPMILYLLNLRPRK